MMTRAARGHAACFVFHSLLRLACLPVCGGCDIGRAAEGKGGEYGAERWAWRREREVGVEPLGKGYKDVGVASKEGVWAWSAVVPHGHPP